MSNAAHQNRKDTLAELTDEEMAETFETNVYAYIRLARASLEHMERGGVILITSSETGILGSEKLPDYSATKGALNAFTKTLAMNVIDKGIRVNAVAPGPVWTPLNPSDAGADEEKVANFGKDSPMKRPAQPEELAPAYVFLASNADSSYITGTILQVMGGETYAADEDLSRRPCGVPASRMRRPALHAGREHASDDLLGVRRDRRPARRRRRARASRA